MSSAVPEQLYHFTCKHSRKAIGTSNCLLIPQVRHPELGIKVLWLTTEAVPDREAAGLGSHYQTCDRMEFRYVVTDLSQCRRWLDSPERVFAPHDVVAELEAFERGADAEHWWITSVPVRAKFDRSWTGQPAHA